MQLPLPLSEAAFRQVLHMQAVMPAIRPDPPPQSAAQQSEQQQQQHFAAAMQATMTMQQALDNEEDTLVAEARGVGIAWPEIAAILPTRSMADLKRRHNTRIAAQTQAHRRAEFAPSHRIRPAHLHGVGTSSGSSLRPQPARESTWPRNGPKLLGDERITLLKPQAAPPEGFTGLVWHKRQDVTGWKFYGAADVVDPDQEDGGETYTFDMRDEPHGACFNLGEDEEGNTLISWSWLHAIYSLPDGSIWAEHSDFIDRSDMEELARKTRKDASIILAGAGEHAERELFRRAGRRHSKLQDVEYQCWVFRNALPTPLPEDVTSASDAFFWRACFHPETLQTVK